MELNDHLLAIQAATEELINSINDDNADDEQWAARYEQASKAQAEAIIDYYKDVGITVSFKAMV